MPPSLAKPVVNLPPLKPANRMFFSGKYLLTAATLATTLAATAQQPTRQQGQIESESVEIIRDREIKLSRQPRYLDPMPAVPKEKTAPRPCLLYTSPSPRD